MPATSAEKHLSTYLIETDIKIRTTQVLQVKLSCNILPANLRLYYFLHELANLDNLLCLFQIFRRRASLQL